jgi:hypothetical protein
MANRVCLGCGRWTNNGDLCLECQQKRHTYEGVRRQVDENQGLQLERKRLMGRIEELERVLNAISMKATTLHLAKKEHMRALAKEIAELAANA